MLENEGEVGGGGDMKCSSFLKGGTENLLTFVEQFIFINLNPILGPPGGKNDTSLRKM